MVSPKTEFIVSAENRASKVLREVAKDFQDLGGASKAASSMLMSFGAGIAGAAAAAFSLRGVATEFTRLVGLQDSFGKLAQQTGVTVESLTELDYAASLSDVSTGELGDALGRLSAKMADVAQGSAEAKGVFDDLGVKVKNTDGTLRSSEEVLKDIAQRFSEFRDGSTKSAFAIEIFGRSGAKLIPMLNMGRAGLAEMAEEARAAGVVFDQDAARKAEMFNDNLTRIGKTIDGLKLNAFGPLVESLGDVGTAFLSAQRHSNDFWGSLLTGFRVLGRDGGLEKQLADVDRVLREKYSLRDGLRSNVLGRAGEQVFNALSPDFLELDGQIKQLHRDREAILRALESQINADMTALGTFEKRDPPKFDPSAGKGLRARDELLEDYIKPALERDKDALRIFEERERFFDKLLVDDAAKIRDQAEGWRELIDPMAQYRKQLEEIDLLEREPDGLSMDEAARARMKVGEDIDKMLADSIKGISELDEFTLQGVRNIQTHLGDQLYDVLDGKFENIGDSFLQMLKRMTADALSANLSRSLFGDFAKTGNIGGLIGQGLDFLTGVGVSGGGGTGLGSSIVPGMTSADDWMLAGLSGRRFATGIDFVPFDNYPALLHRGERVVPAIEASRGTRSPGPVVNLTNNFSGNVDRAQMAAFGRQIQEQTISVIRQANQRGDYAVLGS
jgi:hypothetical protein